jgi:hypothetical protein
VSSQEAPRDTIQDTIQVDVIEVAISERKPDTLLMEQKKLNSKLDALIEEKKKKRK